MAKTKLVSDRDSLWASIMANPGDDAPRLVYADWLEENGGETERAQLIRVQCRLAREGTAALAAEEAKLLKGRQKRWLQETALPKFKSVLWGPFRRGFIDSVTCHTVYHFRRFGTRIAEVIPLHGVHIRPVKDNYPRALLAMGRMKALATVGILTMPHLNLTAEELKDFLESPHLTRVAHLDLSDNPLGNAGVQLLLTHGPTVFPALQELRLQNCDLNREAATALLAAEWLRPLRLLDVLRNRLPATLTRELAQAFGDRVRVPEA